MSSADIIIPHEYEDKYIITHKDRCATDRVTGNSIDIDNYKIILHVFDDKSKLIHHEDESERTYYIFYDYIDQILINTILDIGIHKDTIQILISIMSLKPRDFTVIHGGMYFDNGNFNVRVFRNNGEYVSECYYY